MQSPSATSTSQVGNAPHQRTIPNRLSIHTRLHLWRRLLLKICWLFEMIAQRCKTQAILGEKVYDAWFTVPMPESVSQSSQPVVHRVIKGQAVGRQLDRGTGKQDLEKAHMDPSCVNTPRTA